MYVNYYKSRLLIKSYLKLSSYLTVNIKYRLPNHERCCHKREVGCSFPPVI